MSQKVTSFTVSKSIKVPLKQYSTLDTMCSLTFSVAEGEEPDIQLAYEKLNEELLQQVGHLEPNWLVQNSELKDWYKLVIRAPKRGY